MTTAAQPRDYPTVFQEHVSVAITLPAISATGTYALFTPALNRDFRVERVELISDSTYTSDAANYYALQLQTGAGPTDVADWSTLTGAQGTITAGVPADMVLSSTDANLVIPPGGVLSLAATKHASAANLTVRVVVHGRII